MRKPEGAESAALPGLTGAQVAEYLSRHPDFLSKHPELIARLMPPGREQGKDVIDMQRFMVIRLQREIRRLERERGDLVAISRSNLTSQTRVHAAVLAVMSARSFEHLIETITTDLAVQLDVDAVTLCVEATDETFPRATSAGVRMLEAGTVDALLGAGEDALLRPTVEGDQRVFGSTAGLVRSDALLRLKVGRDVPTGLLALGSRRDAEFHPTQGAELLGFLARAVEHCIGSWLDLPA